MASISCSPTGELSRNVVRPTEPPSKQKFTDEQKIPIKQIIELIRSFKVASSSLFTPHSTPLSVQSNYSDASLDGSSIPIYKGDLVDVLKQNFMTDSAIFDVVSNEIYYYIQKYLHYEQTNEKTRETIDSMNASLTKLTIEKRLQSESSLPCRQLFTTPGRSSGAAADSSPPVSPLNSRSPGGQSSSLEDEVKQLLAKYMSKSTNSTSKTDTLIDKIASDICSKGFFNPETLEDSTQIAVAKELINNVKSNSLLIKPSDVRRSKLRPPAKPPVKKPPPVGESSRSSNGERV